MSPDRLKLVILDTTGAAAPELLAPGVLKVGAMLLRSPDESSPPVDGVQPLQGSWNPAPVIVAATATHGRVNDISYTLDVLDFVLVVFNVETSTPALTNRTLVDRVFGFSASIGTDYAGVWLNPSVAKITILDATGAASAAFVRAGTLLVQVIEGAGLTTRTGDSGSSLSAAALLGLWGSELPPELVAVTASNGNNGTGVAGGDVVTLAFSRDTNTPEVVPTPEVQQIVLTSTPIQDVQVVALTGAGITGFFSLSFAAVGTNNYNATTGWIATTAVATRAEEYGGAYGTGLQESVQSLLEALPGVGQVSVTSRVNGATGGKEWSITFDTLSGNVPLLQLADSQLTFPVAASGLGAGVEVRTMTQGVTLGGYITVSMGSSPSGRMPATSDAAGVAAALAVMPEVDGVDVGVFPVGLGGSVAWVVSFTANIGELPQMVVATDALTGDQAAVAVSTLVHGVTSKGLLDTMFLTSFPLPTATAAEWTDARTLRLTLRQDALTDVEAAGLATLRVAVHEAGAVIRSASGTVPAFGGASLLTAPATGGVAIGGSFGPRPAPVIVTATAVDAAGTRGITTGDRLVVTFDVPTSMPPVGTVDEVDRVLRMSAALGCGYTGAWASRSVLNVTITDAACADAAATAVGALVVAVRGGEGADVTTADRTSPPSTSVAVLSGSWGAKPAPDIVAVVARDANAEADPTGDGDPASVGVGVGDSVVIDFGSPVAHAAWGWNAVGNASQVDRVVTFSHSLGADYAGEFAWEAVVGDATLSPDRSHLLLARGVVAQLVLGPGTPVRFGGVDTTLAAAPTAQVVGGGVWPLTTEQLGNPATLSRLWRSAPFGLVALASPLAAVPAACEGGGTGTGTGTACSLPLFTRSRTRLVVSVTDAAGATAHDAAGSGELFAQLGQAGQHAVTTADGSSPAAVARVRVGGSFGDDPGQEWWELWWVWFLIVLLVLLLLCIPFCWIWLKRNYILCFKNNRMGGETYDPTQKTFYTGAALPIATLTTGEALHEYQTTSALDPAVIAKAVSGFRKTNRSSVRRGTQRVPSIAPNVMIQTPQQEQQQQQPQQDTISFGPEPPALPGSGPRTPLRSAARAAHALTSMSRHRLRSRSGRPNTAASRRSGRSGRSERANGGGGGGGGGGRGRGNRDDDGDHYPGYPSYALPPP